jgi:AcrR family transcriptional regulator
VTASPPPADVGRRERRKLALRARILEAAAELFDERGFRATKVSEICERADVAHKTFFNHFASKHDVLREIAREALGVLLATVEDARKAEHSTAARITRFFTEVAERTAQGGAMHRELVTELVHAVHDSETKGEHARRLHDAFGAIVREGLEAGDVTRRHDPSALTELILGAYYALMFNYANLDDYPIRQQAAAVARVLADALAAQEE